MNATLLSVMLATVFAPPAATSAERSTRIYVRTTPPGASIVLDGKELGTSDGLFLVPPGVRKITLEMDGYDPHGETLDVKEGWITRVEVRMVRKEEKPPEGTAAAVASEMLHFDRTIHDLDEGLGQEAIDLDTGALHDIPKEIEKWTPAQRGKWFEDRGIDLVTDHASNQWALGLVAPAVTLVPADDVKLHEANERVAEVLGKKDERLKGITIHREEGIDFLLLPKDCKAPLNFAFRTAQGTEGFLQIVELNEDKPKSMRLRWKVTKRANEAPAETAAADTTPRKILLPDADTKDTAVILDLASGEMLKLPWESEDTSAAFQETDQDTRHFTKLGKGDLGFDSMLFCLRGGEVELFENGTAKPYKVNGRKDDAKIHQLPKNLPCELVVTTPENRRFLVKVLAETAKGGLDIEYRPLGEKELSVPDTSRRAAAELAAGVLEFCIAANEDEAKSLQEASEDLGWYELAMEDTKHFVTRKQGERVEVLLWQTPEKSMTAGESGGKAWQIIEVSVIAEPNKPGRIGVVFDDEGGRRLQALTAGNIDRGLAMLVDGRVVACPTVRSPISQRVEISGNFSKADLAGLANALQAGMKPERPTER